MVNFFELDDSSPMEYKNDRHIIKDVTPSRHANMNSLKRAKIPNMPDNLILSL